MVCVVFPVASFKQTHVQSNFFSKFQSMAMSINQHNMTNMAPQEKVRNLFDSRLHDLGQAVR